MNEFTNIPVHLSRRLDLHFITCSAALTGAAIGLAAPETSASIIYSGIENLPIFPSTVNGGVYFDLEPPFTSAQGTRMTGWEFNPYDFGRNLYVNGNTSFVLLGGNAANLPMNTMINGSSTFSAPNAAAGVSITEGNTGYIGFKFDPDGIAGTQTFFGWVQMTVGGDTFGNGKVVAWAYENTGAAIQAGAVPEPSSIVLLALGAAGVASWRRRLVA